MGWALERSTEGTSFSTAQHENIFLIIFEIKVIIRNVGHQQAVSSQVPNKQHPRLQAGGLVLHRPCWQKRNDDHPGWALTDQGPVRRWTQQGNRRTPSGKANAAAKESSQSQELAQHHRRHEEEKRWRQNQKVRGRRIREKKSGLNRIWITIKTKKWLNRASK